MFFEWSGQRVPQTGTWVAGCSSKEMGPVCPCSPEPESWILHLLPVHSSCLSFPHSLASCLWMYMHACLPTCVSHRSPPRRRLLSWGDAWVPPVNFTAFICPDEWLAALSVPLPAISSGSLEPHTACRFGRSSQHALFLPLLHTQHTQRHSK